MKRRTVKKQFWFSRDEAQDLQKKAKRTCLSEAALVRLLVKGYEPKERPDERFYDVMRQLSSIGNNINQIARSVNAGIAKPDDAKHGLYMLDRVYELMYQVAKK